ncbi:putative Skp1 family protein [Ochromonadaceae sp. CCMP2298]|nr:putative Skp1 family protein [Ochromonadaceae sp. CCMP2298]|eukprot:CAMPEP_0173194194 /NCGR_PEP_ID=MMETSP1141-20130122/14376_1 /TAXON_ID=483371 /ORGANISM="non described non described, Strain CCMP2298" /LENGTH=169 /DNA_ID=CAMNT_0014118609 /DNA_START=104 /DNA_END=613 /DNA_ORIENTATION=+
MATFELSGKTVKLVSSEQESFTVPVEVAKMSELMSTMLNEDDDDEDMSIPLPNVSALILAKVIEFCKMYVAEKMTEFEKPLKDADLSKLVQTQFAEFITSLDNDSLYHLTLAANYLDIPQLLDLCSARIASYIKGKTVEEIRCNLNIVNDFSPEEEAQVREENKWADDL